MAQFVDHMTRVHFPGASVFIELRKGLKERARLRKERRTYGYMLRMTNRELADIGLTRADIRDAISNTFSHPGTP